MFVKNTGVNPARAGSWVCSRAATQYNHYGCKKSAFKKKRARASTRAALHYNQGKSTS